jgi:radical SAM superfamily enzyme YgiQ (UPF0313 family)
MRVLLVNPYMLEHDRHEQRFLHLYTPLGTLYVAAVLEGDGHEVDLFDATFSKRLDEVGLLMDRVVPDLVGVYSTFLSRDEAIRVGRMAVERGIPVVGGGPDPNIEPEEYLSAGFDAVVIGEGEATTLELVRALGAGGPWRSISGLVLLEDGEVTRTAPRSRIDDLDSIPFPARHLVDMEAYAKVWRGKHGYFALSLTASRGCPFICKFCSRPIFGQVHRTRSVENIIEEIKEVAGTYRPDRIWFTDDILTIKKGWVLELCKRLEEEGLDLEFEALARADLMDAEVLQAMKRAGFRQLYYGVESGSQRVLDAMQKGQTMEDIARASMETRRAGIVQHWFIMMGYPGETREDVESTIDLLVKHAPDGFSTSVAYPIKGTTFYSDVEHLLVSERWSQSVDTKLLFRNRYPTVFYKWTKFRMTSAMVLRRKLKGPNSWLIRLHKGASGIVSRMLAVEGAEWKGT